MGCTRGSTRHQQLVVDEHVVVSPLGQRRDNDGRIGLAVGHETRINRGGELVGLQDGDVVVGEVRNDIVHIGVGGGRCRVAAQTHQYDIAGLVWMECGFCMRAEHHLRR